MSMKLPLLTIQALAAELNELLQGRKVAAVGRLEHSAGLYLSIESRDRDDRLVMSTRPELFIPFMVKRKDPRAATPPEGFHLEEHLRGCSIQRVFCWRQDRIIRLELTRTDEIRGLIKRDLIFELVPRRQNIILLESDRQAVLFALHRVDRRISRIRQVLPGEPYQPPPPPPGLHPTVDSADHYLEAFHKIGEHSVKGKFARLLPWASPYLFDEILAATAISPDDLGTSPEAQRSLWESLESWISRLDQRPHSPTLILDDSQQPLWLLPYNPVSVPEDRKRRFDRLSQALEELFHRKIGAAAGEEMKRDVLGRIHLILHRRRRVRKRLDQDLERAQRADQYHRAGVLLTAHLSRLRKGRSRVSLTDPAGPARKMEITLDPALSPAENARRYFKRSRKARAALPQVKERIRQLDEEIDRLIALREDLAAISDEKELQTVKVRLKHLDTGAAASAGRAGRGQNGRAAGCGEPERRTIGRTYTLPGGWLVLVGRNNTENDELTHRVARPDDLWLHAQGVPGSHVIIRRAGRKDPPGRHITQLAAGLAAHFSRARHSGTVPVILTEKRFVRKPRGAKPGTAAVEREKTLFVAPLSPERLGEESNK